MEPTPIEITTMLMIVMPSSQQCVVDDQALILYHSSCLHCNMIILSRHYFPAVFNQTYSIVSLQTFWMVENAATAVNNLLPAIGSSIEPKSSASWVNTNMIFQHYRRSMACENVSESVADKRSVGASCARFRSLPVASNHCLPISGGCYVATTTIDTLCVVCLPNQCWQSSRIYHSEHCNILNNRLFLVFSARK